MVVHEIIASGGQAEANEVDALDEKAIKEHIEMVILNTIMILGNKNAIIYGAGGSMGGTVARALASAGANVFLTYPPIEYFERRGNQ